jgi:putative peptidoglycan lipid II flippase
MPFAEEIRRVMGQVLFLIIPATTGMLVLRHEIIDVVLKYGKFTQSDALLTAQVLAFLLISLFAQSLIPILGRGFYAFHNTKTPVVSGVIGSAISIGGSLILAIGLNMGIIGIAIAFSIGSIVNFMLLYVLMHKHLKFDILNWLSLTKIILTSIIMGSIVYMVKVVVPFGGSTVDQIGLLILYTVIGLLVYFGLARFLELEESDVIWDQVRRIK